ncbi:HlyD family secretion protein [Labrenzia sp. EL_126]|nr:HlyD family secretion protein [Labrenzia sp. EL_126]
MRYRSEALEKLASAAELDEAIRVTSPMSWVLVLLLLFCAVAALTWAILGSVPTRVIGPAFISYENARITEVVARGSGTLVSVEVAPGDIVEAGEVLGRMENPTVMAQLTETRRIQEQVQEQISEYERSRDAELSEFDNLQQIRRSSLEAQLEDAKEVSNALETRLKHNEDLLAKGITNIAAVDDLRAQFYQARQNTAEISTQIAQLALDRDQRVTRWTQEILTLRTRLAEVSGRVAELQEEMTLLQDITASMPGEVVTTLAAMGTHLNRGETAFALVTPNAQLEALAFMDAAEAKRIEPGMTVRLSPTTVRREEYGTIRGSVVSVSPFPLSSTAVQALVTNPNLAEEFVSGGPPLLVRIALDRKDDGGLAWTSARTPPVDISAGTLASVSVVVADKAPISMILPTFRRWTGLL